MRSLCLALALLALVAGCGGGDEGPPRDHSDGDYATDVSAAASSYLFELQIAVDSEGDPAAVRDSVEVAVDETGRFTKDLDSPAVPEEVADAHGQLVSAVEDFSADLTALADRIDSGEDAAAAELGPLIAGFEQRLGDLYEDFAGQGYRIKGLLAKSQRERAVTPPG